MDVPTTEAELRRWAGQQLGKPISDEIWQELKLEGYVDDPLKDPAGGFGRKWLVKQAYLRQCAEIVRRQTRKRRDRGVSESKARPARRDPVEMQALALSMFYASAASREKFVVRLRKRLFAGRTMLWQEAENLLSSVAPRYLSHDFLVSHGIPLVGHRSEIVDAKTRRTKTKRSAAGKILRIQWSDRTLDLRDVSRLQAEAERGGAAFRALPGARNVTPGSVFDDIRRVSEELSRKFGWKEPDATRFVLTSHPPLMSGISFRVAGNHSKKHPYYRIDLRIQPWVPAEKVREAYREIQEAFYEGRHKQIGIRALQVFNFVEWRRAQDPEITWNRLCEEWNVMAGSRGHRLFRDWRHFRQECIRARRRIIFWRPKRIRLAPSAEDDVLAEFLTKAARHGVVVRRY